MQKRNSKRVTSEERLETNKQQNTGHVTVTMGRRRGQDRRSADGVLLIVERGRKQNKRTLMR